MGPGIVLLGVSKRILKGKIPFYGSHEVLGGFEKSSEFSWKFSGFFGCFLCFHRDFIKNMI